MKMTMKTLLLPLVIYVLLPLPALGQIKWDPHPLRGVPQMFNGRNVTSTFGNPVRQRRCFTCVGELHVRSKEIPQRCDSFRKLWNEYLGRKQFAGNTRAERDTAYKTLVLDFSEKCPYGIEDCFYVRSYDPRIVGYEHRGCGSGIGSPRLALAEPGEGCLTEKVSHSEKIDMTNCVCDDVDYCNGGRMRVAGVPTKFGWILMMGSMITIFSIWKQLL